LPEGIDARISTHASFSSAPVHHNKQALCNIYSQSSITFHFQSLPLHGPHHNPSVNGIPIPNRWELSTGIHHGWEAQTPQQMTMNFHKIAHQNSSEMFLG